MSNETPAVKAEQALLGAVLSDEHTRGTGTAKARTPRLLDQITQWILPGDFHRPYHSQVWSALLLIRQRGDSATPEAVRAELARSPELPKETAQDGLLLHQLMARPPVTSRAPLYAGMVAEASLHRQMHAEAVRFDQAARGGDADRIAAARDQGRQRVAVLRSRWEQVPPAVRLQLDRSASWQATPPTAAELHAEATRLAAELQAAQARVAQQRAAGRPAQAADLSVIELLGELLQRLVSAVDALANMSIDARRSPGPDNRTILAPGQAINGRWPHAFIDPAGDTLTRDDQAQPEIEQAGQVPRWRALLEGRLIGSLIRDQRQIDQLALIADQIADPEARQMYEAAVDTHRSGGVVDDLTIEWAVQRAGGDITHTSEAVRAGIEEGMAGQAPQLADQVAAAAIGDRAAHVAETMRQAAIDPRVPPARMLARADAELAAMPEPCVRHRDSPGPATDLPTQSLAQEIAEDETDRRLREEDLADWREYLALPEAEQERLRNEIRDKLAPARATPSPRRERQQPERQPEPQRGPELHPHRRRPRRQLDREPELEI